MGGMGANEELRIKFFTRVLDEDLRRASGVELVVPGAVNRAGLNGILKHLLELPVNGKVEDAEAKQNEQDATGGGLSFDFLVAGRLLRREDLRTVCVEGGFGLERVVEVEYKLRTTKTRAEEETLPLEDWICALDARQDGSGRLLVGLYSGAVKVFTHGGEEGQPAEAAAEITATEGTIKSAKWIDADRFLCGGSDGVVRLYEVQPVRKGRRGLDVSCVLTGAGADGMGLESVAPIGSGDGDRIAAGSFAGDIYVFETSREANATLMEVRDVKRPRAEEEGTIAAVPSRELEGHTLSVSALRWQEDHSELLSGSWDGTVCLWDVEKAQRVRSIPTSLKAVTDLDACGSVVAAACSDGAVRLIDTRSSGTATASGAIQSIRRAHNGFVSSVRWRAENPHEIASAGHDSSVKLWDIRAASGVSYRRLGAHGEDGKALCLAWQSLDSLVSGGSDGQLRLYSFR